MCEDFFSFLFFFFKGFLFFSFFVLFALVALCCEKKFALAITNDECPLAYSVECVLFRIPCWVPAETLGCPCNCCERAKLCTNCSLYFFTPCFDQFNFSIFFDVCFFRQLDDIEDFLRTTTVGVKRLLSVGGKRNKENEDGTIVELFVLGFWHGKVGISK